MRGRAYDYHKHLRDRYHVPVLTGALYLRVALGGLGTDAHEEALGDTRLRFEFPYAGLPGLDAETYVGGDNLLGVALAALMRVAPERRGWLAAEALRRIVESQERPWRKHLLAECVQAYLQLDDEQRGVFEGLLRTEPFQGVQVMAKTWYEQGEEKALRRVVQRQLEKKFGSLSSQARQTIEQWPVDKLSEVSLALLEARSLEELGLGTEPPK